MGLHSGRRGRVGENQSSEFILYEVPIDDVHAARAQLQRVIRTGRTGHWLNHTKEHMLVGVKTHWDEQGNLKFPSWCNRGLDTDVIVSEVRETSRKPDEVYGLIERMCPGGRKVEIFGRKHNTSTLR